MTKTIEFFNKLIDEAISKGYFKNQEEIKKALDHLKNLKSTICKLESCKLIITESGCPLKKFNSCPIKSNKCPIKSNKCPIKIEKDNSSNIVV